VRLDYGAGFIEHADDRRMRALVELRGTRRKKFSIAGAFSSVGGQWRTAKEIGGSVLISVLNEAVLSAHSRGFTYEKRRGRESNPRIAVLQTATLPLGYPAA
jgi:hypothetical protein